MLKDFPDYDLRTPIVLHNHKKVMMMMMNKWKFEIVQYNHHILASTFCLFVFIIQWILFSHRNIIQIQCMQFFYWWNQENENQNITQLNNVSGLIENKWTFQIGMIDNYSWHDHFVAINIESILSMFILNYLLNRFRYR